ncbi:CGNR zinc finger domain-containing protein [Nocardia otitidiscaviarum]|uniref:CGNR zinc finger domain-containing protein n=1 Tax=Nocardia otitidiscaviarum TaxID=1823 RepID=UPI0004A782FF|nr:CGNR zinc finger domain-containing protein [Nocardia otitidiscaviarum]MBF6134682.1 CGNR zinc finger domain-containing protein [Nocardia otitidiscaviarum]MBF6236372.1 CGNR zinc finger domain-containing protein [Nocardia otitidiscaviarum]MBF6485692.1 CGNR zinc finger domain-containing protein [Nocardia otitidiscaviarum]
MHFNPYGGVAAELAVRLVNAPPEQDLGRLLAEADYKPLGPIDARQQAELRRWSAALDAVFDRPSVELLNALLAATTSRPYISTHDGRAPHLHYSDETAPVDERVKAYTALGLASLFCEDPHRIGRCARDGCAIVFVDTSRNGRRRFCSTRCSTAVHVAAHRRRASR